MVGVTDYGQVTGLMKTWTWEVRGEVKLKASILGTSPCWFWDSMAM